MGEKITKIVIIVWKRTEIKAARVLLTLKYSNHYNFVALFCLQKRLQQWKIVDTNKRAGWNTRAGGKVFSKSINVQTKIRPYRVDFLLKINKRSCTSIRYTRVVRYVNARLKHISSFPTTLISAAYRSTLSSQYHSAEIISSYPYDVLFKRIYGLLNGFV